MSISVRKVIAELADELKVQQEKNPTLSMSEIEATFNFNVDMFIEENEVMSIMPKDPETTVNSSDNNMTIRVVFRNNTEKEESK